MRPTLFLCVLGLATAGCADHGAVPPPSNVDLLAAADLSATPDLPSPPPQVDGGAPDSNPPLPADAGYQTPDAAIIPDGGCEVFGAPGDCIATTSCTGTHTSYAGHCPGPANIECCIVTPNPLNNPPIPTGWTPMTQPEVTAAMTAWAVTILNDPTHYPMFATSTRTFGPQLVLARVEWHVPDTINETIHRGVTLYKPKP